MGSERVAGSFRDPSGELFFKDGVLYRLVNKSYSDQYDKLQSSGLYRELSQAGLLISHEEIDPASYPDAYRVLKPEMVRHISYPYEWSFSQLKDAALLTLDIQRRALKADMTLKDASAYNVQFHQGRPVFIDTLSFEVRKKGEPWVAYRQFCQHFLAPLALMSLVDVNVAKLLRDYIDGIPLPLAAALLPWRSKLSPGLFMHLWLHARSQEKAAEQQRQSETTESGQPAKSRQGLSEAATLGLIDSLESTVKKLSWRPGGTEWFDYYTANNNYGDAGLQQKEKLVARMVDELQPQTVWDLGGNTGRFSRLAVKSGATVVCWDIDPGCVEANYRYVREHAEESILPLINDLSNPSPGIGWANAERMSLQDRGPVDLILALGLIHHLAISNNVPLSYVAQYFGELSSMLLIEFVPREDSQVKKLLSTREDIFDSYNEQDFERMFGAEFEILEKQAVPETSRIIYLMKARRLANGSDSLPAGA